MSFSAEKFDLTKLTVSELEGKNLKSDLILANILFPVLEALSENIAHLLEKGGLVILAGLLSEQKKDIEKIFAEHADYKLLCEYHEKGWFAGAWEKTS